MQTELVQVDPQHPEPDVIEHAAALLRAGQVVAFPTETVYGLGADALNAEAVERIFTAKERPSTNPLIIHVAHLDQLQQVVGVLPDTAWRLMDAFWPGPLTLIVPRAPDVPRNVTAGLASVGIRMPAHPVAHALIAAAGVPVAAPSANRYTRPSPTTAQHVLEDLRERIPLIVDGGPTRIGIESTVLDLTTIPARVLRPGGVSLEILRSISPDIVQESIVQTAGPQRSPGLHLKHYAPRARLICYMGSGQPLYQALKAVLNESALQHKRTIILLPNEDANIFSTFLAGSKINTVQIITLGSRTDLNEIAHNLFAAVRMADEQGADLILTCGYPSKDLGAALNDRLMRAAEGNLVFVGNEQ